MTDYDVLFKDLLIVDGTGAPVFPGDLAVKDGRIAAVGRLRGRARRTVNCAGLHAAPGFIDVHNHSDYSIGDDPQAKNYLSQGVTTLLTGQCGVSAAPVGPEGRTVWSPPKKLLKEGPLTFEEYQAAVEALDLGINMAALVGHGAVRATVMGFGDGRPDKKQMEAMRNEVRAAMEAGAFGLSTGLIYDPCLYADQNELAALAAAAAEYGGFFAAHIRDESANVVTAAQEIIDVARRSGARTQISHHKVCGRLNHGLIRTSLHLMEYYNRLGAEVTCDVYPCVFCSTDLYSFFPAWVRQNGREGFLAHLRDPDKRRKLTSLLKRPGLDWENGVFDATFEEIIIIKTKLENVAGKSIAAVAAERGLEGHEAMFRLLEEDIDLIVISGGISEDDVRYVLKHPLSMVGSDGYVYTPDAGLVHPRSYRSFTRVLAKYARDENLLSLPEAVKKMSCMAAWKMGLPDRGLLKPGFWADLFIFDWWGVDSRSTFTDPHHLAEGAAHVLVNGRFVIEDAAFTDERPGKVLRKTFI